MNIVTATKTCFRKYVTFSGRASRSEFWGFVLVLVILSSAIQSYLDSGGGTVSVLISLSFIIGTDAHWLENVFTLVTFLPFVASLTRRLHDIGKPGYFVLAAVALAALAIASFWVFPLWASIALLIAVVAVSVFFLAKKSQPGSNKYGPNPLEVFQ